MARSVISTQEDWRAVRDRFPRASDDQKFVKEFEFDQTSVVRRTDVTVRDALPNASTTGSRWAIFERAITDGATVDEVNRRAREVSSPSSMPTRDADVFNALRSGYAVLEAGTRTKLVADDESARDPLSTITAEAVREAIAEFDRIGRDEFLGKYGFGRARSYFLAMGSKLYDSKAILGAARGYAIPAAGSMKPNELSGGQATVQRRLEALGFEVRVLSKGRFDSEDLVVGRVYTRKDLAEQFGITDATLNTGVFRPQGSSSVWLFVTEEKTPDRTQYLDHLDGDVLRWQGQMSGRTDDVIIEHDVRGLELLVFYRREKYEHERAGFRYEGPFRYIDHHGAGPTSFVLRRVLDDVARATEAAETGGGFDPTSVEDARKRTLAAIVQRQGQATFRSALIEAYGGRCAITGCDVLEALEAAHIYPYQGVATNDVSNGLLLRSDLHTLFDLRLMTVDPDTMTVVVAGRLRSSAYGVHHGKQIELPATQGDRPSSPALAWHARQCGLSDG